MLLVHLVFDLQTFGNLKFTVPPWFTFAARHGHILFIMLSGLCAFLGHHPVQRGLSVLFAALLITYGTFYGELVLGIPDIRIWFGILHLLGIAMLLYSGLAAASDIWLLVLALFSLLLGTWFQSLPAAVPYLFPLGLCAPNFYCGSDYFPVFPHLGWFLLGVLAGRKFYSTGQSLLPDFPWQLPPLRFLRFTGRHSLEFYLLHQPVLLLMIAWI